jgi:hypothetical protein
MNSGQEASPDSDAGGVEGDIGILEGDTEALERSQDAIEEGREAVREALKDDAPDADSTEPLKSESE